MNKKYKKYLKYQISRAKQTKGLTRRYEGRRNYIYNRMLELGISGKTLLCIGARDDIELMFFEKRGYRVEGIDLYRTHKIMKCDMSKIHKHPYFIDKKYDIVFSNESLEHCLDLDGLMAGLNKVCKEYFICMCSNVRVPSQWDCAKHPFMGDVSDYKAYNDKLLECFDNFDVIINEVHKKGKRLFFILRKKGIK